MGVSKELLMRRRNLGSPHIAAATGAVASFAGNLAAPFKELKCEFTPVQAGSGDPSPSNVRPISGWTGCNVVRCGVNVWDEEWEHGIYNTATGEKSDASSAMTRLRAKNHIPCYPNTQYYVSSAVSVRIFLFYDKDGNYLSYKNIYFAGNPFTTPADAYYMTFYSEEEVETYQNNISINYPSTDTSYHAYTGNTYAVDWTDEAGTVYGGYVDPVRGVLVAEWANIASYNGETLPAEWKSDRDVYVAGTTPTTGAQVVYKLATPIEYPLTPQQITELVGTNNVFSNLNGNTTVKFWKH